jgi:tetrahydromethanopterin S-methyltransferase subunit F
MILREAIMSKKNFNDMDDTLDDSFEDYYYPPMFRCMYEENRAQQEMPANPDTSEMEPTINDINYTQGYLRTLIGKRVRITFLIGTGILTDRVGFIESVGVSYIIIRQEGTTVRILCDIYSIKFVDIFEK